MDLKQHIESLDDQRHITALFDIGAIIDTNTDKLSKKEIEKKLSTDFAGVKPVWDGSMLLRVQSQTTEDLDGHHKGWRIAQRVIDEDLFGLEEKRNNKVFSEHRFAPEFVIGLTRKVLSGGQTIIEINPNMPNSQTVMTAIREGLLDAVSTGMLVDEIECSCGAKGKVFPRCMHWVGEDDDGETITWTINRASYFHQALVSIGGDPGAGIIVHNSLTDQESKRLISKPGAQANQSINENEKQEGAILTSEQKEEIKEQAKLEAKFEQLQRDFSALTDELGRKDKRIIELEEANATHKKELDAFREVEAQREQKRREDLIERAVEAQVEAGFITTAQKSSARETLLSIKPERLDAEIEKMLERCKEFSAKGTKPSDPIRDALSSSDKQEKPAGSDGTPDPKEKLGMFSFLAQYNENLKEKVKSIKPKSLAGRSPT